MLLRANRRQREVAVRTALGASVAAIARMLGAEALVIGVVATGGAVVVTTLILSSVVPAIQEQLGRSAPGGEMSFAVDPTVLAVAAATGLVVALLAGLAPLAAAIRPGLAGALQAGTRSATDGRRSKRMRAGLVGFEIAASLALVSASTLMLRTVVSLVRADLGFEFDRTLIANITLRQSRYPTPADRHALFERTLARLGEMSGVDEAALASTWPAAAAPAAGGGPGPGRSHPRPRRGPRGYVGLFRDSRHLTGRGPFVSAC